MTEHGRRGVYLAAVGVFVVLVIAALAVFQPWKLFVGTTVDEALPTGAVTASTATSSTLPPARSATSVSPTSDGTSGGTSTAAPAATPIGGRFQSYEHETTGNVKVVGADGKTFIRLEDFATSNGPDVVVYLSPAPPSGPEDQFGRDPVNLGSLKGNKGNQNYEVPAGTDLAKYKSVVIWCKRFSVAFGAAAL